MPRNISKARESTSEIDRLYISMRHMSNRSSYKPSGQTGKIIQGLLLQLNPEIYGSLADPEKVELDGLFYVLDRLPDGITETPFIQFTSNEGVDFSKFNPIIPKKRRRTCYRVDEDQMNIEITRGRSEIYDMLTHLTFLYNEADKIRAKAYEDLSEDKSLLEKDRGSCAEYGQSEFKGQKRRYDESFIDSWQNIQRNRKRIQIFQYQRRQRPVFQNHILDGTDFV